MRGHTNHSKVVQTSGTHRGPVGPGGDERLIGYLAASGVSPLPGSSEDFFDCSACRAAARFMALGPLFFFFRRAAARSDLESLGAEGMPPSIHLTRHGLGRAKPYRELFFAASAAAFSSARCPIRRFVIP